jgi:hypothetical protein
MYHSICATDASDKARPACDKDPSDVTFMRRTKVCLTRRPLQNCDLDIYTQRRDSFDLLSATEPCDRCQIYWRAEYTPSVIQSSLSFVLILASGCAD